MSVLAQSPDLTQIIKKAVDRIGENHSLARDTKGVEMSAHEVEKDRLAFRKQRMVENKQETTKVIEEALKAVADEMAEKMVLENTIDGMVKDVINEQQLPDLPEGCEDCLREAIGKKYESKAITIIIALGEFMTLGTPPTIEELLTILSGIDPLDALTIGPRMMTCFEKCSPAPYVTDFPVRESTSINETSTDTIKKLVGKKLKDKLKETKMPGYDAFQKAYKQSTKETKNYHKDLKKKLKDYTDYTNNSDSEFPHQNNSKTDYESPMYRNTTEDEEFVDDFAYPGLQDFDVHNQDMDRLTKYLEGSSDTGNAQTDKEGEALGNVVPSKLGEKIKKSIGRRKEKIAQETASMTNLRGITPDVQKVVRVKEEVVEDLTTMKKLWNYKKITQ
tara:strand:+ start:1148 stop:2317 length:1170 start_codon:yes stop_codon:yes gene_type:complete